MPADSLQESAPLPAPSPTLQAVDGLPTPQRYLAMTTVLGGIGLSVIDGTVMNLALPGIARDLQVSASSVVWVVNAYQVAILALLLPLARLGELLGYKRVYLTGLALFTLASLACMASSTLLQLSLARAVQGAGAAGMFALNAALVRRIYPRRQLGRGIALNSAVVAVGSVAGPSLAALILSFAPWPWLFALNVPLGLAVLAVGLRSLPESDAAPSPGPGLSVPDALLNMATFTLLFLGVGRLVPHGGAPATAEGSGLTLALLAAATILGTVYVQRQRRQAVPLLPIDLLRIPIFRLSMLTSVSAFFAHTLASIALPFLLLHGQGRSAAQTGAVLTAWPIATLIAAPMAGRLIGRVADGLLAGIGLLVLAAGLGLAAWVAALPEPATLWQLAAPMALCGAGFGLFQSPNNHTIVTSAPAERSGAAGGMLGSARLTGQSIGAVAIAALFSLGAAAEHQVPVWALALAAVGAAGASVTSLMRLKTRASCS